jgi:PAS domain-containing protein
LERQLARTKELFQVSVEELERLNEALSSANEELQSANEELQSSNEEYENTKEQLESGNEELATLNEELQNRNVELDQTNIELTETRDYAEAIIKTMRQPLVVLDANLRIRSANDAFCRVFEVPPAETDHAFFLTSTIGNGMYLVCVMKSRKSWMLMLSSKILKWNGILQRSVTVQFCSMPAGSYIKKEWIPLFC